MRFNQVVQARIQEQVVPSRTVCDGCGKNVNHTRIHYIQDEVTIKARLGPVDPDGDDSACTVYDIDVCAICFTEKVVPALATAGLHVRVRAAYEDDYVLEPGSALKETP